MELPGAVCQAGEGQVGAAALQFVYLPRPRSRDIGRLARRDKAGLEAAARRQRGSWSPAWASSLRARLCQSPPRGGAPARTPLKRLPGPGPRDQRAASLRTTCSGVCLCLAATLM